MAKIKDWTLMIQLIWKTKIITNLSQSKFTNMNVRLIRKVTKILLNTCLIVKFLKNKNNF